MAYFPRNILKLLFIIITLGTVYSVVYETYLDTSNPLITHLPHHLHQTHYFANKKNALNVYFIKKTWGWTTAAFVLLFATSPQTTRKLHRVVQYLIETAVWIIFTGWFFGPAILERFVATTGGACVVALPAGGVIDVPHEFCYTKTTISPATHPSLFTSPFAIPDASWNTTPRLRKGHDVSGHLFLLTMSILFLADQIRYSFAKIRASNGQEESLPWSPLHILAVIFNIGVVSASIVSVYATSVYFHTPFEKFSGFLLGGGRLLVDAAAFLLSHRSFIPPLISCNSYPSYCPANVCHQMQ
ncbi:hypothetical protein QCA50_004587 [Cerrena zonata]|uniref:FIT family protein scs3 n=1 Tax=Cerrena zonata TaxID=2478898 RepID=A0AAW0GHW5_9APHY